MVFLTHSVEQSIIILFSEFITTAEHTKLRPYKVSLQSTTGGSEAKADVIRDSCCGLLLQSGINKF